MTDAQIPAGAPSLVRPTELPPRDRRAVADVGEGAERTPDSQIIKINFSARLRPVTGAPPVVTVLHGWGFYWLKTYNAGWSDNGRDVRPIEGFWFDHKHQYIFGAKRAQLVALTGDGAYIGYEPELDASRIGTHHYRNTTGRDWNLYFYMNDDMAHYDDNSGSANCDFFVFRLEGA